MNKDITWFQLMWKNFYIQMFIIAIIALVVEFYFIDSFYTLTSFIVGISIPIFMILIISYLGFYRYWQDIKKMK